MHPGVCLHVNVYLEMRHFSSFILQVGQKHRLIIEPPVAHKPFWNQYIALHDYQGQWMQNHFINRQLSDQQCEEKLMRLLPNKEVYYLMKMTLDYKGVLWCLGVHRCFGGTQENEQKDPQNSKVA